MVCWNLMADTLTGIMINTINGFTGTGILRCYLVQIQVDCQIGSNDDRVLYMYIGDAQASDRDDPTISLGTSGEDAKLDGRPLTIINFAPLRAPAQGDDADSNSNASRGHLGQSAQHSHPQRSFHGVLQVEDRVLKEREEAAGCSGTSPIRLDTGMAPLCLARLDRLEHAQSGVGTSLHQAASRLSSSSAAPNRVETPQAKPRSQGRACPCRLSSTPRSLCSAGCLFESCD